MRVGERGQPDSEAREPASDGEAGGGILIPARGRERLEGQLEDRCHTGEERGDIERELGVRDMDLADRALLRPGHQALAHGQDEPTRKPAVGAEGDADVGTTGNDRDLSAGGCAEGITSDTLGLDKRELGQLLSEIAGVTGLLQPLCETVTLLSDRQVSGNGHRSIRPTELIHELVQPGLTAGHKCDAVSHFGELAHELLADARRRAGDEGNGLG